MKGKLYLLRVLQYAFLLSCFILAVFPFFWMVVGATNTAVDIIKGKISFGNQLIPNLNRLFSDYDVTGIFWNSCKISLLTVLGQLLFSSMAGYGFELFSSKTRERIYGVVLLTMMVPFAALMIPLFRLIVSITAP